MIDVQGVYVLWLRDLKRYFRARSRVIGSLGMPFFFLAFLGTGFRRAQIGSLGDLSYIDFLTPGVITMVILFTSMFSGISIVWDRQFGFLREILVSPVSRTSIALGRIFGGATQSLIQAILMLAVSTLVGFKFSPTGLLNALIFMILTSVAFTGVGITFSTFMKDVHGFQVIINFFIFPVFFLSGAIFPLAEFPGVIKWLAYFNPLTYCVDGMRWSLTGYYEIGALNDLILLLAFSLSMILVSSYFFGRMES